MTEFDQIYRAYFQDVFRYTRKLANGNEPLAEDITSEAFFRAMHSMDRFRGDCDVRVWLCQIAKNCYYSYLQTEKKNLHIPIEELTEFPDYTTSLEECLQQKEYAEKIQDLLHNLEEPYKEVFMWRAYGELSFKQIGAIFHKTDNWACVTYHRARSMIRKRMEDEENEK